jgi:DNA adenine methylase
MNLKPLLIWTGGKGREIDKYIQYIPDDIETYLEPFVGGGATFFYLNHNKNVISDLHTELIDFYQCIKEDKMVDIYNFMTEHANNEQTYLQIRDHMEINFRLDNAKRFYYLRKTCFRGFLKYNKDKQFTVCYGMRKSCNFTDLKNNNYVELLKNTTVLNTDFEYIFENYNDEKNFMFLDPPYDCKLSNYGYSAFGKEDHKKISRML